MDNNNNKDFLLNEEELMLARTCLSKALCKGASKARVTISKSVMDLVGTLNGETDKITHCLDRVLTINLFVDGRYGAHATNRCEESELDSFLDRAINTTRMLAADEYRDLPDPSRLSQDALTGLELGLYDPAYEQITPEQRVRLALDSSIFNNPEAHGESYDVISEEAEYSDAVYDSLTIDSGGCNCRHIETSFDYGVEMTIQDHDGNRYTSNWWDSRTHRAELDLESICPTALHLAVEQMGPKRVRSGRYNIVIDTEYASKAVSSILKALSGFSLQQGNSFLVGSLDTQVFPEGLTILDCPHIIGESGSRLYDSEGVATRDCPIIENGVVKRYFLSTYNAAKMGMEPTNEDYTRPRVMPWPQDGLKRDDLLQMCGDGILITGFNGGNSNSTTGDFSYGIEGFAFKGGHITHPIREMVMTGDFISLWQGLIAIADDARPSHSKLVPSLAFKNVNISA